MEYFQSPGIRNQENAHIFSAPELYIIDPEYGSCMDFCSSDLVGLWVCSKRQDSTCKGKEEP